MCVFLSQIYNELPWITVWTAIGSLATLVTALVTYYTVREMKKAREQNIRPLLVVLDPIYKYEFRWIPLENLSQIIQPELRNGEQNRYDSRLPVFRLKNIGNAPAKNIKFCWSIKKFNLQDIINNEILRKYNSRLESGMLCLTLNIAGNIRTACQSCSGSEESTIDYCISSPANDFVEPIDMPFNISAGYDFILMTLSRPNVTTFLNGPDIDLLVSYYDLENKKHRAHFIIKSKFDFLPNEVSSQVNSLNPEFVHTDNMRGFITYHVREVSKIE